MFQIFLDKKKVFERFHKNSFLKHSFSNVCKYFLREPAPVVNGRQPPSATPFQHFPAHPLSSQPRPSAPNPLPNTAPLNRQPNPLHSIPSPKPGVRFNGQSTPPPFNALPTPPPFNSQTTPPPTVNQSLPPAFNGQPPPPAFNGQPSPPAFSGQPPPPALFNNLPTFRDHVNSKESAEFQKEPVAKEPAY